MATETHRNRWTNFLVLNGNTYAKHSLDVDSEKKGYELIRNCLFILPISF